MARSWATLVSAAALTALVLSADKAAATTPTKKLIEWGWDEPSPAFMRTYGARMDGSGFDGVVFHLTPVCDGVPANFTTDAWSAKRFKFSDFDIDVDNLANCHFKRLVDNFVRLNVGDVDWFDDESFATVLNNVRLGALVALAGGAKGLMFDVETYGHPTWYYQGQTGRKQRSLQEFETKVRARGAQFARSLNASYPDITVLLTYGYSLAVDDPTQERSWRSAWLLKPFLDGFFGAVQPGTKIVDANERAYALRRREQFDKLYREVHDPDATSTAVPGAYLKHVQAGFGLMMDYDWRARGWHTTDVQANYFAPDQFASALSEALRVSDEYVWVYTEQPNWWTFKQLPPAYRATLRQATRPTDGPLPETGTHATPRTVRSTPAPSDLSALASSSALLIELARNWRIAEDPTRQGVANTWFKPGSLDLKRWREAAIPSFWDESGLPPTAVAWYRLDWTAPDSVPRDREAFVWFGAVAETATVWVNGVQVATHDNMDDRGWDAPFAAPVKGLIAPGQVNVIVVRAESTGLPGGIWKSVYFSLKRS